MGELDRGERYDEADKSADQPVHSPEPAPDAAPEPIDTDPEYYDADPSDTRADDEDQDEYQARQDAADEDQAWDGRTSDNTAEPAEEEPDGRGANTAGDEDTAQTRQEAAEENRTGDGRAQDNATEPADEDQRDTYGNRADGTSTGEDEVPDSQTRQEAADEDRSWDGASDMDNAETREEKVDEVTAAPSDDSPDDNQADPDSSSDENHNPPVAEEDQLPSREEAWHETQADTSAANEEPGRTPEDTGPLVTGEDELSIGEEAQPETEDAPVSEQSTDAERGIDASIDNTEPSPEDLARWREMYRDYFEHESVESGWAEGANVVGEKPDRSPGDTSDLPPTGAELVEMDPADASRLDKLRHWYTREFDHVDDAITKNMKNVQDALQRPAPPTGSASTEVPTHPAYLPQMTHATVDAGSVAELALVLSVIGIRTKDWAGHKVSEMRGRTNAGDR